MKLASMANYQQDGIISVEYDPVTGTGSAKVMINGQEISIGGGSAMLICKVVEGQLDKTAGEIYDAYRTGSAVLLEYNTNELGGGDWSSLLSLFISASDNSYYCSVTFANSTLVTDEYTNLEDVMANYPHFTD